MATRGRTTFQKRQKEMARKERQRLKAERRAQRKAAAQMEQPQRPGETDQAASGPGTREPV